MLRFFLAQQSTLSCEKILVVRLLYLRRLIQQHNYETVEAITGINSLPFRFLFIILSLHC
jgi:hypothetical protein